MLWHFRCLKLTFSSGAPPHSARRYEKEIHWGYDDGCLPNCLRKHSILFGEKGRRNRDPSMDIGPNDEDLSTFVAKVAFSLHPSFAHPVREVATAPFEITETGWGEFEAGIRIFFKDPDEQPLDIAHTIKLYHGLAGPLHQPSKQPVMSEFYDEIVFTDPSTEFLRHLMTYTPPSARKITDMTEHYTVFSDQEDLRVFALIQDHLRTEIEAARTKLLRLEGDVLTAAQNAVPSSSALGGTLGSGYGGTTIVGMTQGAGGAVGRKRAGSTAQTGAVGSSSAQLKATRPAVATADRRRGTTKTAPLNKKTNAKSAPSITQDIPQDPKAL